MKRLLFLFLLLPFIADAQSTGYFRFDTSLFYKVGGNNEMIIQNSTRDTLGYLYNYGSGRTRFDRPRAVTGGIKFGNDTILVSSGVPTLQQVLDAGSTLTTSETISVGTNSVTFDGSFSPLVAVTSTVGFGAGRFRHNSTSTNAVADGIAIDRLTDGTTAADGIGTGIRFSIEDASGTLFPNRLKVYYTNATTKNTFYDFEGYNAGTDGVMMNIQPTGIVRVNNLADTLATRAYARSVGGGGGPTDAFEDGGNAFGANATIGLTDNFNLDILTNNTARVRITDGGNVLIGTTTDNGHLLRVVGNVQINLSSDATGDIFYRNSGGSLTRRGIGSTGQVLTVSGGLPVWATPTAYVDSIWRVPGKDSIFWSKNGVTNVIKDSIGSGGGGSFINNSTSLQTSADFNIDGTGTAEFLETNGTIGTGVYQVWVGKGKTNALMAFGNVGATSGHTNFHIGATNGGTMNGIIGLNYYSDGSSIINPCAGCGASAIDFGPDVINFRTTTLGTQRGFLSESAGWNFVHTARFYDPATFDDELILTEIATPGNPAAGKWKLYFKSDGLLYKLSSGGTETQIGGGGGSGTVTSFTFTDGSGLDGTVTNSTTTPTLAITSTVTDQQVMISSTGAFSGDADLLFDGNKLIIGGGTPVGVTNGIALSKTGGVTHIALVNGDQTNKSYVNLYDQDALGRSVRFQINGTGTGLSDLESQGTATLMTTGQILNVGTYSTSDLKFWSDNTLRLTIASGGVSTFTADVIVPDDPYDATGWNGNFEVPTKNAIRDKIESLPPTAAGTYTPTLTGVTNIGASTAYQCQYLRVGDVVTVSGKLDIDPTATGATELGLSLPIASGVSNDYTLAGAANSGGVAAESAQVSGDPSNSRASIKFVAVDVTNKSYFFTFTYIITAP